LGVELFSHKLFLPTGTYDSPGAAPFSNFAACEIISTCWSWSWPWAYHFGLVFITNYLLTYAV